MGCGVGCGNANYKLPGQNQNPEMITLLGDVTIEKWQVIAGVATFCVIKGLDYVQMFLKDRRERLSDAASLEIQKDQANNLRDIRNGQIAQNGKLALVSEVNKAYHEEIIRVLRPMEKEK